MIQHHPTCHSDYPEKPDTELAQSTTDVEIGDGEVARTCNDCGAFEIIQEIFLHFCTTCGTVQASQIRLTEGEATHTAACPVCKGTRTFSPVAIQIPDRAPLLPIRFVTRRS